MSSIADVVDGLVDRITAALPTYTASPTFLHGEGLTQSSFPLAMVYDVSVEYTELDHGQREERTSARIGMIRSQSTANITQMRTDIDTLDANIRANGTLGGVVERTTVKTAETEELHEDRVYGILDVETFEVT